MDPSTTLCNLSCSGYTNILNPNHSGNWSFSPEPILPLQSYVNFRHAVAQGWNPNGHSGARHTIPPHPSNCPFTRKLTQSRGFSPPGASRDFGHLIACTYP